MAVIAWPGWQVWGGGSDPGTAQPLTPSPTAQDLCGTYTFIPYAVTAQNKVVCCDAGAMKCLTELFQPSFGTEPFFTPLAARLVRLLEGVPTNSWYGRQPPRGCPSTLL